MGIILEYLIVFVVVYLFNCFLAIQNNKKDNMVKKSKKNVKQKPPQELVYLKNIYNINIKKVDYKKFSYIATLMNSFIITTIYIILVYLVSGWILRVIIGLVLIILMTIICYGLLGRYLLWKEGKRDV